MRPYAGCIQPALPSKCEHLHWITVYNSRRRRRAAGRRRLACSLQAGRIVRPELTCQFTAYNTIVLFIFLAAWRNSDTPTSGKKNHIFLSTRDVLWPYSMPKMRYRPGLCPGPHWGSSRHSPQLPSRLGRGIPPHHTPCHASILTPAKMLYV